MLIHGEILRAPADLWAAEINARGLLHGEELALCLCLWCSGCSGESCCLAASPKMILELNPVRWSIPQLPTSSWGLFLGC